MINLISNSPTRAEILREFDINFRQIPFCFDEGVVPRVCPQSYSYDVAIQKKLQYQSNLIRNKDEICAKFGVDGKIYDLIYSGFCAEIDEYFSQNATNLRDKNDDCLTQKIIVKICDKLAKNLAKNSEKISDELFDLVAKLAFKFPAKNLLFADSSVICDNQIYGKAQDDKKARKMLKAQSANFVSVITAMIFIGTKFELINISQTRFKFDKFDENELEIYIKSGDWRGKAGAMMIEGFNKKFILAQEGMSSTARGLSAEILKAFL